MNYKEKVEELKRNGILNDNQAQRLSGSFENNSNIQHTTQRKYTLEIVGALLFLLAAVYIVLLVGMGNHTTLVESTEKVLNSPVTSGLQSSNSFVMIVIFITLLIYLLLYLLAHNRYNALENIDEQKRWLHQVIHNSEIIKVELGGKLEELLHKTDIEINIATKSNPREYLMGFYTELEEEILSCKNQLALLETKCVQQQNRFPNTLAKLVGKPPQCK